MPYQMLRHACNCIDLRAARIARSRAHLGLRRVSACAFTRRPYRFVAPVESATQHLAALLAADLRVGDCYCLFGAVGAGKSVFSRAFIRAAANDDELPVPSPTYLLQQIYEENAGPQIHHFDLYRLDGASGIGRLDLPTSFREAVTLIEWADNLQDLPSDRLEVHIALLNEPSKPETAASTPTSDGMELAYEDKYPRRICLTPKGQLWTSRMESLASDIASDAKSGLVWDDVSTQT